MADFWDAGKRYTVFQVRLCKIVHIPRPRPSLAMLRTGQELLILWNQPVSGAMLVPQATKGDDSVTWIGQRSCRLFLVHLRRRRNMGELEGPKLALCDWQLFSAMQRTSSSDRCKQTGTNSRSCM